MAPPARLGGFKILKDVVRISAMLPLKREELPVHFFQVIAGGKINLPYISCIHDDGAWEIDITVEAVNAARASELIEKNFGKIFTCTTDSAILSIFPHKKDPEITGSLFEVLGQEDAKADALANSPSAISVILKEEFLSTVSNALFEPFSFSAYRTPSDWKLAQKGKEQLYKEVVASYQEKRPKVYGLEYQDGQELLKVDLINENLGRFGTSFKRYSLKGLTFTFLTTRPAQEKDKKKVFFCFPLEGNASHTGIIHGIAPEGDVKNVFPVGTFSMNGPHFGDRYGITSELLTALKKNGIELLGLNCTIASIIGVIPSHHLEPAIQAIQGCFEVPSITKKE